MKVLVDVQCRGSVFSTFCEDADKLAPGQLVVIKIELFSSYMSAGINVLREPIPEDGSLQVVLESDVVGWLLHGRALNYGTLTFRAGRWVGEECTPDLETPRAETWRDRAPLL